MAAFLSLAALTVALSSGTLANAVEEGTIGAHSGEKQNSGPSLVDEAVIPIFRAIFFLRILYLFLRTRAKQ